MCNICDKLGVHTDYADLPQNIMGLYNEHLNIIFLDARLAYRQKRCTLTHELIH